MLAQSLPCIHISTSLLLVTHRTMLREDAGGLCRSGMPWRPPCLGPCVSVGLCRGDEANEVKTFKDALGLSDGLKQIQTAVGPLCLKS